MAARTPVATTIDTAKRKQELSNLVKVIALREFESVEVALSPESHRLLTEQYAGRVDVGYTVAPGIYRLTARDYVGRVSLPGEGMLVIRPKVGVANLFYMLCAEAGTAQFQPPPTGLEENSEIFPFVVAAMLDATERVLAQGLYVQHALLREDLPLIRGRLHIGEQLSRHGDLRHRHVCHYTDLTVDTAENRVVAAALRCVPALLSAGSDRHTLCRARLLTARFQAVTHINRGEALRLLRGLRSHRLNVRYAPLLSLCSLVLNHLTLDEKPGPHPYASFLVDMPLLFERFVTRKLTVGLRAYGLRVVAQRHDWLDEEQRIGIRPDLLVFRRSERAPCLVLDTKYARLDAQRTGINSDLYQLSAYMDRYKLREGILVYPQFEGEARPPLRLRGTAKHLHTVSLDLDAVGPRALDDQCEALVHTVAGIVTRDAQPGTGDNG